MRYYTFLLLFSLCLSVFAQKKMTIRNSDTGEEMTITVPDGLVITSGIEGGLSWLTLELDLEREEHGNSKNDE